MTNGSLSSEFAPILAASRSRTRANMRRLVLPVPRLAVRYVRPHSQRSGTPKSSSSRPTSSFRPTEDPDRLSETAHSRFRIMSGNTDLPTAEQSSAMVRRKRLPITFCIHSSFVAYPTPRNLNYLWTFVPTFVHARRAHHYGVGAGDALHAHVDMAFRSVESIMRDVNFGWLLRYSHANGALMFFLAVYIHMFRGIYYGSYKEPREVLWYSRPIIYLLMMATGFMGYVLVWGQMSFWAATVITTLSQPFRCRRRYCHVAVGWLCRRQSDTQSFLFAALPAAVRYRRRGGASHLGAACRRSEQSDRHSAEVRQGPRGVHAYTRPSRTASSWPRSASSMPGSCFMSRITSATQTLHSGESSGDAG